MRLIYDIAQAYRVPVLIHFQHGAYNTGFERFYKILERYHRVTFIAHAQTFWTGIGQVADPKNLYPRDKVTPGGLSDKWLADYPNLYGDLAAGSGLNALTRDEDFARGFLTRHQKKLLYGSDCQDVDTKVKECCGSRMLAALHRLAPNEKAVRKLLYENARRVLKIR
jgi:predicted TIM-barrel fold metal-dependent hydrolase